MTPRKKLYRAQDPDRPYTGRRTWWCESLECARAYADNPGFGGTSIVITHARGKVLDLANGNSYASASIWAELGPMLVGNTEFDRLLSRISQDDLDDYGIEQALAENVSGSGYEYVHDVVSNFADALHDRGFVWVKVTDSFPSGATTWMYLGDDELPSSPNPSGSD